MKKTESMSRLIFRYSIIIKLSFACIPPCRNGLLLKFIENVNFIKISNRFNYKFNIKPNILRLNLMHTSKKPRVKEIF